jgi:hypothetical protein
METPEEFVQEIYKASADSGTMDAEIAKLIASRDAAIRKESKWISVKERLPEENELVLAYGLDYGKGPGKHYVVAERRFDKFYYIDSNGIELERLDYITHWMPLPEPPVGKEGEE